MKTTGEEKLKKKRLLLLYFEDVVISETRAPLRNTQKQPALTWFIHTLQTGEGRRETRTFLWGGAQTPHGVLQLRDRHLLRPVHQEFPCCSLREDNRDISVSDKQDETKPQDKTKLQDKTELQDTTELQERDKGHRTAEQDRAAGRESCGMGQSCRTRQSCWKRQSCRMGQSCGTSWSCRTRQSYRTRQRTQSCRKRQSCRTAELQDRTEHLCQFYWGLNNHQIQNFNKNKRNISKTNNRVQMFVCKQWRK